METLSTVTRDCDVSFDALPSVMRLQPGTVFCATGKNLTPVKQPFGALYLRQLLQRDRSTVVVASQIEVEAVVHQVRSAYVAHFG
jgi:hypothetical protein